MSRSPILITAAVRGRPTDADETSAAAALAEPPCATLSIGHSTVDPIAAVRTKVPSLPHQLAALQAFHASATAGCPEDSPLHQLQLDVPGPQGEILGYYERRPGGRGALPADQPPRASLFSCAEMLFTEDLAGSPFSTISSSPTRQPFEEEWPAVFRSPLTVFDDRYGADDFWPFLRAVLCRGACRFDEVNGERYCVQLQGVTVPIVEMDREHSDSSNDGGGGAADGLLSSSEAPSLYLQAESKSFDLLHFLRSPQEECATCGERGSVKYCIPDAATLDGVLDHVEQLHSQIESTEGPVHVVFYVTFVKVNDAANRHSLCIVRLDDISLQERLAPAEFRSAEVVEMLVEELSLALSGGSSGADVFAEEGINVALGCSRLTTLLRRMVVRNYEAFARQQLHGSSRVECYAHWLFNFPAGTVDPADRGPPVVRVTYTEPSAIVRGNKAADLLVRFQEINMECAVLAAVTAGAGNLTKGLTGRGGLPKEASMITAAPPGDKPPPLIVLEGCSATLLHSGELRRTPPRAATEDDKHRAECRRRWQRSRTSPQAPLISDPTAEPELCGFPCPDGSLPLSGEVTAQLLPRRSSRWLTHDPRGGLPHALVKNKRRTRSQRPPTPDVAMM